MSSIQSLSSPSLFSFLFSLLLSHLMPFFLITSTLYIFKISPSICLNPLLLLSSVYVSLLQEVFTSNLACLQPPAPSSYPIPSPVVTEPLLHSSPPPPPFIFIPLLYFESRIQLARLCPEGAGQETSGHMLQEERGVWVGGGFVQQRNREIEE